MAKKQSLTREEMLEQALVPEREQPYRVPGNWVWTRLGNVALYKKEPFGSSITKEMFVPKGENTYKVYEQGNAIRKDKDYGRYYITEDKYGELKGFEVKSGDLIVSCAGTIGEVYLLPHDIEPGIINQALMKINVNSNISLKFYLFYFDQILREDITGHSKGTAIKNIPPFSVLKNMFFPLPPRAEQQRIVDRIESLFEKLDQAKGLIQEAIDSFENRKAALLYQAFSGELTKKWREENGVGMESWENVILSAVCTVNPKRANTTGLPNDLTVSFIPMSAVSDVLGAIVELQNRLLAEVKKGYTNFSENDIIFAKITPCMENGKAAIVGKLSHNIGFGSTEFHVLRCTEKLNHKFLYHLVRSQYFRDEAKAVMTGAVGQQRVPKSFIESYPVQLPLMCEQREIVRILDSWLDKEQKAKELYDIVDNIDLMKKSILARAFRGQLGTNDLDEESAVGLLAADLK